VPRDSISVRQKSQRRLPWQSGASRSLFSSGAGHWRLISLKRFEEQWMERGIRCKGRVGNHWNGKQWWTESRETATPCHLPSPQPSIQTCFT
jgi:hypothetical protein